MILSALHHAFHRRETRAYRVVEAVIYALIALSVVLFLVQLGLSERQPVLEAIDLGLTWFFVLEYTLRLASFRPPTVDFYVPSVATRLSTHLWGRLRYALTPMMLVDLLTVLSVSPQLRGLRAIRLLRLLRATRVFRYSNPFASLTRAFVENRLLFAFGLSLVGGATVVGGLSIYVAERSDPSTSVKSVGDGLWWALVTLTTVGYGDISPVTTLGKGVGAALMITGMFSLALFAGLVGHALLNAVLGIREEQFRMSHYVNHLVVCGYEPGARLLLNALLHEIDPRDTTVVLFGDGERPHDVPPEFVWVSGDPTKESELDKARIAHARAVMVIGSRTMLPQHADARTLLILFTIRRFCGISAVPRKRPVHVVAEVLDAENVEHATTAGADEVIETTRLGYDLLAHTLVAPGTGAVMSAVASAGAHSVFLGRLPAGIPPGPFGQVAPAVKAATGALIIGLRGADGTDQLAPPDDLAVSADAHLLYLALAPQLESP
ncbi:MAG: ion transporter [Myxococcales bacterium]|nr:ion transporter [Myxococcales bacterium]MCB9525253.1 ion transporter [Myxococcales bacterium]